MNLQRTKKRYGFDSKEYRIPACGYPSKQQKKKIRLAPVKHTKCMPIIYTPGSQSYLNMYPIIETYKKPTIEMMVVVVQVHTMPNVSIKTG